MARAALGRPIEIVVITGLVLLAMVLGAAPAHADGIMWNNKSWKNCETTRAYVRTVPSVTPWDYGKSGVYYVKWKIWWQAPKRFGGGWKTLDTQSGTSKKYYVSRPDQIIRVIAQDKTRWGWKLYDADWRVKIRATVYKVYGGPDKRWLRDRIVKTYHRPRFRERGSCDLDGIGFGGGSSV